MIVGKRALPALALAPEELGARWPSRTTSCSASATAPSTCPSGDADWRFAPDVADPFIAQELLETTYHLLWELVHVFFEHSSRNVHDAGASSFLYPFMGEAQEDVEAVVDDVRALGPDEGGRGRRSCARQTLAEGEAALRAAAAAVRRGGRVLALGNGGSATDAMDLVADLRAAGRAGARPHRGQRRS